MNNKQEELQAIVHQENYDIVAFTETLWDDLHNWNAGLDGYRHRQRTGKGGSGVALSICSGMF